jgi:hypothetical protein
VAGIPNSSLPAQHAWPSLPLLLFLVTFVLTTLSGPRLLFDPDPYLHITVGRWIAAHGAIPHYDMFSYSVPGAPWVAHEWLAQVILAGLYSFGWAGLVLATALCFAAAIALLLRALLRILTPSHALIGAALAAGLSYPHLFARPHALSLPLLVIWVSMLVTARIERRAPPLYAALLIVPWANIHSSYVFGLAIAGLLGAEALFEASDWREAAQVARTWGLFGALALLAALATPNGFDGLLLPVRLLQMDFVLSTIQEWQSPNFQLPQPLEPWLMLLLLGALSFGLRLPITRTAMLLLLLHMALQHQRNAEFLGLAAPLLLAPALAPQLESHGFAVIDNRLAGLGKLAGARGIVAVGAVMLAVCAIVVRTGIAHESGPFTPARALASVEAQHVSGPVFNDMNFGDYMIYAGVAPFIDGRADMYGDAFLRSYADLGAFPKLVAKYGCTWAIFSPKNPHVPLLDNLPGWRRIYADETAIVYRRQTETGF